MKREGCARPTRACIIIGRPSAGSLARHQRSLNAELREIVRVALTRPQHGTTAELKKLAADIRAFSAGRRQTPSEDLLRESRRERWRSMRTLRCREGAHSACALHRLPL
ncbi:MAG: hypothetical protein AB7P21_20855 [Lautropia sp.]